MSLVSKTSFALAMALTAAASLASAEGKTPSHHLADGWNHYIYEPFVESLASVPVIRPRSEAEQARCDAFYSRVRAKGSMKIVMGIGYYDFSEGEPFSFEYRDGLALKRHDFGMNATIDNTYMILYRDLLTRKCRGKLQFCGFKETAPGIYAKTVKTPEGRKIKATIEVRDSSVTPEHSANIGPLKAEQSWKSDQTTRWFFDTVNTADLVVYNGHSRKGGGPDFEPPKLLKNLHVNYAWYDKNKPGLTRLLAALDRGQKPAAVLMMSCNSVKLFEKPIARSAPGMGFAGTNAVIPGDIPNKAAIAGMDAFLKFQCQEGFRHQMQLERDLIEQIKPLTIH